MVPLNNIFGGPAIQKNSQGIYLHHIHLAIDEVCTPWGENLDLS